MSKPKIKEHIVVREEDEEAFLFNAETGEIKLLNPTGAFIYRLCDGTHDLKEIMQGLLEAFEGEKEENIKKDLDSFFERSKELGFLE